jgi:hypothetical protein
MVADAGESAAKIDAAAAATMEVRLEKVPVRGIGRCLLVA